MLHVHIGLSPLAQALILPVASSAELETVIVGPAGGPLPPANGDGRRTYELKWEGAIPKSERLPIHAYLQPSSIADLRADVRARVESPEAMLLTASIRDRGIEERRVFVRELLNARPRGSETVVMACENRVPDTWREIEQEVDRSDVTYVDCVVNRIAVRVEEEGAPAGTRATRTHPTGEWLVQHPGRELEILEALNVPRHSAWLLAWSHTRCVSSTS